MQNDLKDLLNYCRPIRWQSCTAWVQENINLDLDSSSGHSGNVDLSITPYLKKPLDFWCRDTGGKMTVMAVEQTGKSSVWKWGMLWIIEHAPAPSLIVYPSAENAADTAADSFEPLMHGIPRLAMELSRPHAKRRNCYRFSSMSLYYAGGGADIISKPLKIVVGDEVDFWIQHADKVDNVRNLDKRGRTFPDALRVLVCSPTERGGIIAREFHDSSQGYWHLRCEGCGELTMRSADIFNMQWEMRSVDDDRENLSIIPESIRLVCPKCKREHFEKEKRQMNIDGDYVHAVPERLDEHEGYQWGALASQFHGLRWIEIAKAQLKAGRSANINDQKLFDNSFRGLPFYPRKSELQDKDAILKHCGPAPAEADILNIFMGVDTQDNGYFYVVMALCRKGSMHVLRWGFEPDNAGLLSVFHSKQVYGIHIISCIVDEGGHRPKDVAKLVTVPGIYAWKGGHKGQEKWAVSKTNRKRLLGRAKMFQADLLYYLYSQPDRSNSYLFFPEGLDTMPNGQDLLLHVSSMKPNKMKKDGDLYENWECDSDRTDHYFDCLKILLCMIEYARRYFPAKVWRGKVAPAPSAASSSRRPKPGTAASPRQIVPRPLY
jgi:hypothetical protein